MKTQDILTVKTSVIDCNIYTVGALLYSVYLKS